MHPHFLLFFIKAINFLLISMTLFIMKTSFL